MTDRMYIFTRQDLKPGYQAVQSCHSAILMNPDSSDWNGHMILLSVPGIAELKSQFTWLSMRGHHPQAFYEPDLNFQMTSFSVMLPEFEWNSLKHIPTALKKSTTILGWLVSRLKYRYE